MGSTIRLVSIPENTAASKEYVKTLFPDSQPRSSDSELEGLYKFTLREAENFLRTHALALRIPTGSATSRDIDAGQNPRIVDEDHPEKDLQDDNATTEGRGKKKKVALLLPLLLFLKLKALLVPILLGVLFIKKLLILAAILLPSLLSFIKLCKPSHGHSYSGWISAPDISGDYSSGYSHSGGYHGDYHGRRSSRWAPHSMAYRGYHRANEEHTGV
ncbi:hypothetical protein B7P43_G07743 [Cryptotermes secundus]|uniref:Uncharacterized protein n=1 Tax=Cryptotermes secundus TaxID=105785 RepID=A0A2J7QXK8_9NEOP|nr:hypothetical protein B7P43_G07743 [Cryptotermes secundus]